MESKSHPVPNPTAIEALVREKEAAGPDFPVIGILMVGYETARLLADTLRRIPESLVPIVEEVFVFDDFSQDDIGALADELSAVPVWRDRFNAYMNPNSPGYGECQKLGFRHAIDRGFDQVVILHCDGRYAPELIPDLLMESVLNGKPVVFGSRMMGGASAPGDAVPPCGWLGNTVLTRVENILSGLKLSDYHSGFRLYSTAVLKQIPFELNTGDEQFDAEMIIQCRMLGVPITEVPTPSRCPDGNTGEEGPARAWNVLAAIIRYRLHQIGLVFEQKYIPRGSVRYTFKASPYSSHGRIIDLVRPDSEVLDVGCGTGLLSRRLSDKGVRSLGIDFEIKENVWGGFETYIQDDLETAEKLPRERVFDYVILADVLEHLLTPSALLKKVRPLIKPDGKLVASTGNIALWYMRLSLLLGRFNYGKRGLLDETHVYLYTRYSFVQLLTEAGFRVDSIRVTSLPFEVVFKSTGKSGFLKLVDRIYYRLARLWPTLFAYQFVVEASVRNLESSHGEGRLTLAGPRS